MLRGGGPSRSPSPSSLAYLLPPRPIHLCVCVCVHASSCLGIFADDERAVSSLVVPDAGCMLPSEVVLGACHDGSKRVRETFIRHDPQLTGRISLFKVSSCLRAAGLTYEDEKEVVRAFLTADTDSSYGMFDYLSFCTYLERQAKSYSSLGYKRRTLPVNVDPSSLPPLLRMAGSHGSLPGHTNTGVWPHSGSDATLRQVGSKSLLLRSPHPQAIRVQGVLQSGRPPPRYPGTPPSRSSSALSLRGTGSHYEQASRSRENSVWNRLYHGA